MTMNIIVHTYVLQLNHIIKIQNVTQTAVAILIVNNHQVEIKMRKTQRSTLHTHMGSTHIYTRCIYNTPYTYTKIIHYNQIPRKNATQFHEIDQMSSFFPIESEMNEVSE